MKIITNALQTQFNIARWLTPECVDDEALALAMVLLNIGAVGILALQFIK